MFLKFSFSPEKPKLLKERETACVRQSTGIVTSHRQSIFR